MTSELPAAQETAAPHLCPAHDARKTIPHDLRQQRGALPAVAQDESGVWQVHGYDEARQILRSALVHQAGFMAEVVLGNTQGLLKNPPILYLEGEAHHRMRRETNKFFTPAVTDRQYRAMMDDFADGIIADFQRRGSADLSTLTMQMALRVAAQIVGLTNSLLPGMEARLTGMLHTADDFSAGMPGVLGMLLAQRHVLSFLLLDVRPAIRARRARPQDDVISYLVERGYSDLEILTECVVYGVAGMVTTREFIAIALWHLLDQPRLRERMLVGEQDERYAILHEILRLEPIVGHLQRRATADLVVESSGQAITIPAGALINLNLYAANTDPAILGEAGYAVCPMRPMQSAQGKVPEFVMSFGDGAHRCPGAFVAIQESDIFLRRLLALPTLRIARAPDVSYSAIVKGYEVRNFRITVDRV